jgi:cytochrome c-type biogenesis protein CcmH
VTRKALFVVTVATFAVVLAAPYAHASADDVASSVANEVASPFCPGVTLENCPSDAAVALRAKILAHAEAGWSKDRILTWLEDEYGPSIRAVPRPSGTGLWAWLAPGLALLAGVIVASVLARRWTARRAGEVDVEPTAISGDMRARIDDELRALRGEA